MIKDKFSVLEDMVPRCIVWKLGFLVSLLLLLFPTKIFASENSGLAHTTDSDQVTQKEELDLSVIHINEGTVVYGMENISLNVQPIDTEDKKQTQHKILKKITKHAVAEKILKKVRTEQITKLPEVNTEFSSHNSEDSFKLSTQQFRVATLTNIISKIAILNYTVYHQTVLSLHTNSLYTIFLFLKGGLANSTFFTRPPPFI